MRKLSILILFVSMFAIGNCASGGFGPTGFIFTSTKIGVHGTSPNGAKSGEACAQSFLGLVAIGDASVSAAAAAGGITAVQSIDIEVFSLLVYGQACTVVRGN
ncbi:MAG: TRL-like family protein [Leptospiraceae bacterium]|nr:TRL-like family protein [Leptospiraceae bacterium]